MDINKCKITNDHSTQLSHARKMILMYWVPHLVNADSVVAKEDTLRILWERGVWAEGAEGGSQPLCG